jgi:MoaA/NifB/PqqE/SkfB family radical SAM enzyme
MPKQSLGQSIFKKTLENFLKTAKENKNLNEISLPQRLVFIVTSRCNFTCKHCLRDLKNTEDLPLEIAQKVLEEAKKFNFKNIALTGGEPLLYPHLKELIHAATKLNYGFSVITNGFIFSDFADFFIEKKDNLRSIGFSLESSHEESNDFMRKDGSFKKLNDDFSFCHRHKIPFHILTVITPQNYTELFDIALFAKKKGAQLLQVATTLPCPRSKENNLTLTPELRQELFLSLKVLPQMIKFPVIFSGAIRVNSNIQLCDNLGMREVTINTKGDLIQCCDFANYQSASLATIPPIASLKSISFSEALKKLSESIHRFNCMRIDDYGSRDKINDIDFNSCFYCFDKLKRVP